MEQASGSIMRGIIRAFSANLPLTSLLRPSTAFRLFVYFQVNTGVSDYLDYVEDIYDGGPLCPPNVPAWRLMLVYSITVGFYPTLYC